MPTRSRLEMLWHFGSDWELALAEPGRLSHWRSSDSFAAELRELVRHNPGNAFFLRRFMDSHRPSFGDWLSDDELIAAAADGLARGLFELREHPRVDLQAPTLRPDQPGVRDVPLSPVEPARPLQPKPVIEPDEQEEEPTLLRLELGALGFYSLGVLTLPRAAAGRWHRWAALTVLARYLRDHAGAGFVALGHQETGEPAGHSERRAAALVHFIRGETARWVEIAAKWGRVRDTQEFLGYLQHARGWDLIAPAITDEDDDATATAVLDFQRIYNATLAEGAAIYEDGIIGQETLGAIFEVARAELLQWFEVHGCGIDDFVFFDGGRRAIACEDRFKPYRTMPPLPAHHGPRFVDLVVVPPEAAAKVDLGKGPAGAGVYDVGSIRTIALGGVVPPRTGLVLEIVLRDDRDAPFAGTKFEVVLPGGAIHRGTLDDSGEARIEGLVEGPCSVTFPELTPGIWSLEGTTPL